jgi:hypothetical protein
VLPYWRKEKETVILPKDFETIYTRQLKFLDDPQAYANRKKIDESVEDDDDTTTRYRRSKTTKKDKVKIKTKTAKS